jgi:hypothetical protein
MARRVARERRGQRDAKAIADTARPSVTSGLFLLFIDMFIIALR